MEKRLRILQIMKLARDDFEAIGMILSACADVSSRDGVLLSVSKFDIAAEMILYYFEQKQMRMKGDI